MAQWFRGLPVGRTLARAGRLFQSRPDSFLRQAAGVIHVGANTGQERKRYARHGLRVIWIEPVPEVFEELERNLRDFPAQKAYRYLVTDQDDQDYDFHVANNFGESSSIFDLRLHRDVWPTVNFERSIALRSITLTTLIRREHIDPHQFDALVLDTQGAELLVLKGAAGLLHRFQFIKVEAADFESYANGCRVSDIADFLHQHGFREFSRHQFAAYSGGGGYYDIVYTAKTA